MQQTNNSNDLTSSTLALVTPKYNKPDAIDLSYVLTSSTWPERFALNLFSYSLVLLPITIVVLGTKFKLFPACVHNNILIQWFVLGNNTGSVTKNTPHSNNSINVPDRVKLLVSDEDKLSQEDLSDQTTNRMQSYITFAWCFIGLQVSYLIWGVLQEKIMTTSYISNGSSNQQVIRFHDSQFLVFMNRIIAFILSILALVYYQRPTKPGLYATHSKPLTNTKPQAPLYEYIYCSLSNILSSWCQYEALKYVNFPTQVLSKSCKIVPVMLVSKIMLHKRYQTSDYTSALMLSLGMFIFLLNQPISSSHSNQFPSSQTNAHTMKEDNLIPTPSLDQDASTLKLDSSMTSGLIILAMYLAFDSFTSNWQQNLFSKYDTNNWQMMAATNFYSILLTLTSLQQLGNLGPALKTLRASTALLTDCILMSVMSSIGQLFVYYTIKRFGSVLFAVIMTLRQFFAILLSCTIYGHTLTLKSSCGLMLVFVVVGHQMWRKSGSPRTRRTSTTVGVGVENLRLVVGSR